MLLGRGGMMERSVLIWTTFPQCEWWEHLDGDQGIVLSSWLGRGCWILRLGSGGHNHFFDMNMIPTLWQTAFRLAVNQGIVLSSWPEKGRKLGLNGGRWCWYEHSSHILSHNCIQMGNNQGIMLSSWLERRRELGLNDTNTVLISWVMTAFKGAATWALGFLWWGSCGGGGYWWVLTWALCLAHGCGGQSDSDSICPSLWPVL